MRGSGLLGLKLQQLGCQPCHLRLFSGEFTFSHFIGRRLGGKGGNFLLQGADFLLQFLDGVLVGGAA